MQPTPFNPKSDLPPLPFEDRHCQLAASLKQAGLSWTPHVMKSLGSDEAVAAGQDLLTLYALLLNRLKTDTTPRNRSVHSI
jgi:hypothetical protein